MAYRPKEKQQLENHDDQQVWHERPGCRHKPFQDKSLILKRLMNSNCGYAFIRDAGGTEHLWINPEFVTITPEDWPDVIIHYFGRPEVIVNNDKPKRFRRRLNYKKLDRNPPAKSSTSVLATRERC